MGMPEIDHATKWVLDRILAPLIIVSVCALGGNLILTGKLYYEVKQMQEFPTQRIMQKMRTMSSQLALMNYRLDRIEKGDSNGK